MTYKTAIPTEHALKLHAFGLSDSAIASELGYTPTSITRWRNKHNLKRNSIPGRKPKHLKTILGGKGHVKKNA